MWRVAWRLYRTGYQGHGSWLTNEDMVRHFVAYGNLCCNKFMTHWVEYNSP